MFILNWEIRSKSQMTNFPHAAGVCGWDNYHVYPWKKSKYQGILWYNILYCFNLIISTFACILVYMNCWCNEFLHWSAVIYPSLLQLQKGVTDTEDTKQKAVCMERYRKRDDEEHRQPSDIDIEREEECGICMEMNSKIVLPDCNHVMCLTCYHEWYVLSLMPTFPYLFMTMNCSC